jgi:hypothetical protein
MAVSARIVS